jgi:hypothetical protein
MLLGNATGCRCAYREGKEALPQELNKEVHKVVNPFFWFYFACIVSCIGLRHYYQGEHNNQRNRRNGRKLRIKKEVREGGKYAKERVVFSKE